MIEVNLELNASRLLGVNYGWPGQLVFTLFFSSHVITRVRTTLYIVVTIMHAHRRRSKVQVPAGH